MAEHKTTEIQDLIKIALDQLNYSYSPYSGFCVGASLLAKNGKIYRGSNIENASFGATNCAERSAIFTAVSEGVKEFEMICIVGGQDGIITDYCPPCGICRQVMAEFCDPDFLVILAIDQENYMVKKLEEILPLAFQNI